MPLFSIVSEEISPQSPQQQHHTTLHSQRGSRVVGASVAMAPGPFLTAGINTRSPKQRSLYIINVHPVISWHLLPRLIFLYVKFLVSYSILVYVGRVQETFAAPPNLKFHWL